MWSDIQSILDFETSFLVMIAIGYLSFRIAYVERIQEENTTQTVFLSACFAALFQTAANFLSLVNFSSKQLPEIAVIGLSALLTLLIAIWWRRDGMKRYAKMWKSTGGNHLDGLHTVLDTIRTGSDFKPTTLLVAVDDGPFLYCSNLGDFKNFPFGPCLIGGDGSIAMYVTHTMPSGGKNWEETEDHARNQITIIPANRVKLIETRVAP